MCSAAAISSTVAPWYPSRRNAFAALFRMPTRVSACWSRSRLLDRRARRRRRPPSAADRPAVEGNTSLHYLNGRPISTGGVKPRNGEKDRTRHEQDDEGQQRLAVRVGRGGDGAEQDRADP